jgi:hypothetical protein
MPRRKPADMGMIDRIKTAVDIAELELFHAASCKYRQMSTRTRSSLTKAYQKRLAELSPNKPSI